jgi:hypothetical protein
LYMFILVSVRYALKVAIDQVITLEPHQFWLDRILDLSSSFGLQVNSHLFLHVYLLS